MSRRSSRESRQSIESQAMSSSDETYVSPRMKDNSDTRDNTTPTSPNRADRLEMYAEQDATNIISAQREASRGQDPKTGNKHLVDEVGPFSITMANSSSLL